MCYFVYFGHFYRLDNVAYGCRSTLEIVSQPLAHEVLQDPQAFLDCHSPDAIFVMMNPGASHPCNGIEPTDSIDAARISDDAGLNLVPTCPDHTQKQLEKVMQNRSFDHVRVLNVFDLREKNSTALVHWIKADLQQSPFPFPPSVRPYSIFSNERRLELQSRLNTENSRVVAAWGANPNLDPFYMKCYELLCEEGLQVHGWSAPAQPPQRLQGHTLQRFYHPLVPEGGWVTHITDNWPTD